MTRKRRAPAAGIVRDIFNVPRTVLLAQGEATTDQLRETGLTLAADSPARPAFEAVSARLEEAVRQADKADRAYRVHVAWTRGHRALFGDACAAANDWLSSARSALQLLTPSPTCDLPPLPRRARADAIRAAFPRYGLRTHKDVDQLAEALALWTSPYGDPQIGPPWREEGLRHLDALRAAWADYDGSRTRVDSATVRTTQAELVAALRDARRWYTLWADHPGVVSMILTPCTSFVGGRAGGQRAQANRSADDQDPSGDDQPLPTPQVRPP